MALRKGHGLGAGVPRIEALPMDELPLGVQAPVVVEAGHERRANGQFEKGASTQQKKGGKARKARVALATRLHLDALVQDSAFAPYLAKAKAWRTAVCNEIAQTVGGGICGVIPSSMILAASLQRAAAQFLHDRAAIEGDADLHSKASRIDDAHTQNLAKAHEYAAKAAKARPAAHPFARAKARLAAAKAAEESTE